MIKINKDMSYLSQRDLKAIENGIATLSVHSINLDRFYTEEQKEQNRQFADTYSREEWSKYCVEVAEKFARKMESIVSELAKHFTIYQYKNCNVAYSSTEWELFHYRSESGDYVQLNPNRHKPLKEQLKDIEKAINIIQSLEVENVAARIQYKASYDDLKVSEIAKNVCEKFVDTFINYGGYIGKIKVIARDGENLRYAFYKKGAKKNCYQLNEKTLLDVHFENLVSQ